jgi:hypothetical protein
LSGAIDPDELLDRLREGAPEPPLSPLRLGRTPASTRPSVVGRAIDSTRRWALALIAPALGDLLVQLERDRQRQRAEIARLCDRVEQLERRATHDG